MTAADLSRGSSGRAWTFSLAGGSAGQPRSGPSRTAARGPSGPSPPPPRSWAPTSRRRAQHRGHGDRLRLRSEARASVSCRGRRRLLRRGGAARPGRPRRPPRAGFARGALSGRAAAGGQDEPRASERASAGGRAREGPGGGAAGRMAQLFLNIKPA